MNIYKYIYLILVMFDVSNKYISKGIYLIFKYSKVEISNED